MNGATLMSTKFFSHTAILVVGAVFLLSAPAMRGVTLANFGYTNDVVNGKPALGTRPLLAIFVNFEGQPPLLQSFSFYSNLVFNPSQTPSMAGYYSACSDGAFTIVPGGAIQLTLPASQNFFVYSNQYPPFVRDGVYASNIIAQAMLSGKFNFASYDANHDGHITADELSIMIVVSDVGWPLGGSRSSPVVSIPGANYDWGSQQNDNYANVALLSDQATFTVFCEETEETWGALDIYGPGGRCLSMTLSPQSCFYNTNLPSGSYYYLDPWNRMELGWCQPRIYSMTAGGVATISAAQAGDPTAPILLYDPSRGPSEFFILEYRTSSNSIYGPGYDLDEGNDGGDPITYGLAIWHVQEGSNLSYNFVTSPEGVTNTPADWSENSPNLLPGDVPSLWGSNSTTPNLKWIDGTSSVVTIHVRSFNIGDNTITVEWLAAEDTWVDFNFTGSPQNGSFSNPYNTMAAGLSAASYGGTLHIKTGSSPETPTITKKLNIVAYNGPATIGK